MMFDTEIKEDPKTVRIAWIKVDRLMKQEILDKLINMPSDTETVDLSGNKFALSEPAFLMEMARAIRHPIKNLDLSFNELGQMSLHHLLDFIGALPAANNLNFCHNSFGLLAKEDILRVSDAINPSAELVNFSRNKFDQLGEDFLVNLINRHPERITITNDQEVAPVEATQYKTGSLARH